MLLINIKAELSKLAIIMIREDQAARAVAVSVSALDDLCSPG